MSAHFLPTRKHLAISAFVLFGVLCLLFQVKAGFYPFFLRDLALRSQGTDVSALQRFLNTQKTPVAEQGPGSAGKETGFFGRKTKAALTAFQNQHSATILTPFGLATGTGAFTTTTRNFLNTLLHPTENLFESASSLPSGLPRGYVVGGTITGLSGTAILKNDRGERITVQPGGDSRFVFPTPLPDGRAFQVTLEQTPAGETCYTSAEQSGVDVRGVIQGADVTSIQIQCASHTNPFQHQQGGGGGTTERGSSSGAEAPSDAPIALLTPVIHTVPITINDAMLFTVVPSPMSTYVSSTSPGTLHYSTLGPSGGFISGLLVIMGYGTSTILISQDATDEYAAATSSLQFVANATRVPSITHFESITKNYGDTPFILAVSSTSEGAITYSSLDHDIATVSGSTVTIHHAGTTFLRLQQGPAGEFLTTTTLSVPLTVNPIAPDLTFNDITRSYDGESFLLPVTSTSAGAFGFNAANETLISITGSFATILASGTTTLTVTQAANGDYTAATATALLTVPGVCAEGACGSYSSSCSIDGSGATCYCVAGVTGARCNIGINACAAVPCGTHGVCTRTSTLGGISPPLNSYSCACNEGFYGSSCSLLTPPPEPDITFASIIKYFGDAPFALAATSTSGGSMRFGSSNVSVATISGGMCTVAGTGTSTITLYQSADGDSYASTTSSTLMTVYENYCTVHGNPCLNGGTCSPHAESYTCSCPEGFSGGICESTTVNCDGSHGATCQNGGVCTASPLGGECACGACFTGATCEIFDALGCA